MKRPIHPHRKPNGSFAAEMPVALWFLLVGLTLPLLDMGTVAMRSTFLIGACRDGVHQAARSQTFQTSISPTNLSAQQSASAQAISNVGHFPGVTISSVNTYIVQSDLNSNQVLRFPNPLAQPADTSRYTYHAETVVTGQIEPLFKANPSIFGNVPGFTGPITMTVAAQEFFEFPQGLNQ